MRHIKESCDGTYTAAHDSGTRSPSDITYVVIHSTEGDTAQGAAAWFENVKSEGSTNIVIDDDHCYRTVADLRVPWAAPPLNRAGFHVEIAGYARWTKEQWLRRPARLHRAAFKAALRCKRYGIPVRQVGWLGLRLGRKGICSHNAVSKAWHLSDHHDPGPGFPWREFIGWTRDYYDELDNTRIIRTRG